MTTGNLTELIAFVESVKAHSFSAAARTLGTTPSAISKRVAKLEDRLGVRLLQRTTRSLSLTPEGATYYDSVSGLLQELTDVSEQITARTRPHGKLTVSASVDFGQSFLVQVMPDFLAQYPDIELDLRLSDRLVNLVNENIDVALRLGSPADSSLIRQHLGETQLTLCASPDYLAHQGTPQTPEDLIHHNCMRYVFESQPLPWEFWLDNAWHTIPVTGSLNSDNGDILRQAALAGMGFARLLDFQIRAELQSGALVALFPDQMPPGLPIQAVFVHKRHLSPRVQVFLDFMVDRCRQDHGLL
ncbi:MAG: LysR family transcriptional regulator [Cyanobacteria bacterium J06632_22]